MFDNIRQDIEMYGFSSQYRFFQKVRYLLCAQEFHAVAIYRFGKWSHSHCNIPVAKQLCKMTYLVLRKFSDIIIGVGIWPESDIGPGLKIEHWGGIYIKAKIGRSCRISQQVVIGHIGGFKGGGVPILGDNVYVGVGAKILGDVKIGNNVKIGANAVVITDVPDDAIAVGVPAQIKWPKGKV